ncbi:hypothetical protein [Rheinheimera sp. 4Y26]|uniref:hypothetical protein n=1 Tax=Rheinheimera sp. 4Y26 TaxID=2977811 RepID=UPI0021B0B059|nr:hypothetical protein [Rheinheimera sp. 4Y26]MCT6699736.1 hypothetical protein [Rheinheimera sp. 4Y26]
MRLGLGLLLLLCAVPAWADGRVVDKVYHPYVQPLEREFEYRFAYQKQAEHPDNNAMAQKLGYGFSIAERMAFEFYVIADRVSPEDYKLSGYELELRWMLTEQGQYSADWGMLFELERQNNSDNYEFTSGLLMEKEFGPTSLTLNGLLVYEWGQSLESELETEFRLQYRYRWLPAVQPAIEFYAGENYRGAGPSMMGVHKFSGLEQLKWEFAVIFAIDASTVNNTLRFALEYEF